MLIWELENKFITRRLKCLFCVWLSKSLRLELLLAARNLQQFNVKDERGTARDDAAGTTITIAQMWRDGQLTLLANAHVEEALGDQFNLKFLKFHVKPDPSP